MERLSVIAPYYKVAAFVPETLRSLQRAGRPGFEFLLVDDGATDGTGELMEQLAPSLPGARVLHQSENRGLSAARNLGLNLVVPGPAPPQDGTPPPPAKARQPHPLRDGEVT